VITVVGLSHKSAPIEVRERFALPADRVPELLRGVVERPAVGEALLVSTCNRVELVAAPRSGASLEAVAAASREVLSALAPSAPENALYALTGGAAVRHLFGVAASLDSLVLGEPQILGQVKDAYELARTTGTVGSVLHRTLARAIRAAKRVRSGTAIGAGQVSVPSVAVDFARRIFGDLRGRTVLLVGSGEMAETVARSLLSSGSRLLVIGRTPEKVRALAESFGGEPCAWNDLAPTLERADVVITSTSAPNFVVEYAPVATARKKRRGQSQFFIDLAVPRDVNPEIESLDGIFLYNVDDLSRIVSESLLTRGREAAQALAIIDEEAQSFDRWADAEQATPLVVALRERIGGALRFELERSLRGRLRHLGAPEREALDTMVDAAVNRVLHEPTTRLRQAASVGELETLSFPELSAALEHAFALDRAPGEPARSERSERLEHATPSSPRSNPHDLETTSSDPRAAALDASLELESTEDAAGVLSSR
jgi:glutamyl-tRNA reductase